MPKRVMMDVRVADAGWTALLGEDPEIFADRVLQVAAQHAGHGGEMALLLTDDAEMRILNRTWRSKDAPTNVLSFPAPEGFGVLGDVAMARETVEREALAQGKRPADHAAHLLAHGFLHLLGHDHQADDEAEAMESLERVICAALGLADPYGDGSLDMGAARER